MARSKVELEQANLHISVEAARLLAQLAPDKAAQGQYVSQLIVAAAQRAGLVPEITPASPTRPATVQEVSELREEIADLKTLLTASGLIPASHPTLDPAARADILAFLDERIQQAEQLSPEARKQAADDLATFKQRLNENRAPEPPLFL